MLTASDRPPLLRAQIGLVVGATSAQELEERVALVRREYQPISLHRPLGEQQRLWMAHLPGSRVIDIDPKGDHHLDALIGEDQVERIDLGAEQEHRGLRDPLRVAPQELRADLAFSFLVDLLPAPVSAGWQTEIRAAVSKAVAADERSCEHVLRRLDLLGPDGTAAARAICVHAESW